MDSFGTTRPTCNMGGEEVKTMRKAYKVVCSQIHMRDLVEECLAVEAFSSPKEIFPSEGCRRFRPVGTCPSALRL
jgi:hypothetical protein